MAVLRCVIGADVGGTNTDAVILHQQTTPFKIVAHAKSPTTVDVNTGVKNAIHLTLKSCSERGERLSIQQVNIGTTHFINAVVEGKNLAPVAVIRLCGTASKKLPPYSDFPAHLADKVKGSIFLVNGGYQFDGREISPVDETEIIACLDGMKKKGEKNVVVSGIFSTVRSNQEKNVEDIIRRHYPEASVTLSHVIGQLGLLERENAAIINECIKPLCKKTIGGFRKALDDLGLSCPMFLTQNDGTLINEEDALKFPVYTFASGATNSMRGAAFLSGLKDALVIDIGGTSSDIGILIKGFPREASTEVTVGGIRTNFRMPDVMSIGLGGGSYVNRNASSTDKSAKVTVGPLSAGYRLRQEAYVFGEKDIKDRVVTATDIAVAAGLADIGQKENVKMLDTSLVKGALQIIHDKISACVDQMRFNDRSLPLVLVGGGSVLVDRNRTFDGVSEIISPEHFDVANAVGAALSQVSASEDIVVNLENEMDQDLINTTVLQRMTLEGTSDEERMSTLVEEIRKECLAKARENAIESALSDAKEHLLRCGGDPLTVYVVEKSDTTLAYIPGNATHIKIKIAADLLVRTDGDDKELEMSTYLKDIEAHGEIKKQERSTTGGRLDQKQIDKTDAKTSPKTPHIDEATGEWILTEYDIECISIGAGIMGCGGGGNPHLGKLAALKVLKDGKKIRIISPEQFAKGADEENDLVVTVAYMGAPVVMYEKLMSGTETSVALQCIQDLYSVGDYSDGRLNETIGVDVESGDGIVYIDDYQVAVGKQETKAVGRKRVSAIMSAEIGGMNSIEPLIVGAEMNLPVLDCDGMGRAFPELQMFSPFIYGCNAHPSALGDDKGRRAAVLYADGAKALENYFRRVVVEMGCSGGVVLSHFTSSDIMRATVKYSMSHAWRLGDTVLRARHDNRSPVQAVIEIEGGKLLINGKITDFKTEVTGGFSKGFLKIDGLENFSGQHIAVDFQNEFLIARRCHDDGSLGEILACVPDLITLLDPDTAQPVPTEELRFGVRVSVVATAAAPLMRTEQALKFVGPQAFGYPDNIVFKPVSDFIERGPVGPK